MEELGGAGDRAGEDDLFDIPTQNLVCADGYDELPIVDQLFSQVPLPAEFSFGSEPSVERCKTVEQTSPMQETEETEREICEESVASAETTRSTRFGLLVSRSDIADRQKTSVPPNTHKNTNWALNVWKDWVEYCKVQTGEPPPYLFTMEISELDEWLSRFVLEVRRKNGKVYPPNSLHQLCCGILRAIREYNHSIDFFKDPAFASFRKTLDAEMKRLKADAAVPITPKRVEAILDHEEEVLWKKGLLGSHSPQSLVDTMVFMSGLYFALQSGDEHRNLHFSSVKLVEKEGTTPYLIYIETVSKE